MNEIIPFGKHRGKPVETLAADPQYANWLTCQDWFRERYPDIHTIVINNYAETDGTPEHNRLQARFLDAEFVRKFVGFTLSRRIKAFLNIPLPDFAATREELIRTRSFKELEKLDKFESDPTNLKKSICINTPTFEEKGADVSVVVRFEGPLEDHYVTRPVSYAFGLIEKPIGLRVEIKPSLGDDYPAVIRQMRASRCNILIIDDYAGSGATLNEVRKMFNNSGIAFVSFSDIECGET